MNGPETATSNDNICILYSYADMDIAKGTRGG